MMNRFSRELVKANIAGRVAVLNDLVGLCEEHGIADRRLVEWIRKQGDLLLAHIDTPEAITDATD